MSDIRFLNVDLGVESREPLEALLADLGEEVDVLLHHHSRGLHRLSVELADSRGDAESTLASFCVLLANLSPEARATWDGAVSRSFDIGFESGDHPRGFQAVIHPQTLQDLASFNSALITTIYPPDDAGA